MRLSFVAVIGGVMLPAQLILAQTPPAGSAATPTPPPAFNEPKQIDGKTLDEWIRQIDHNDPGTREEAIRTVVMFGPSARRAIPALVRQVNNQNDHSPLTSAIVVLGYLMPVEKDPVYARMVVDALTIALNHPQAIVKFQAATALNYCGAWSRPALPKLAQMVEDRSSWETRQAVCTALGQAGRNEQYIPDLMALIALVRAIDDPSKEVRAAALQSIITLGPPITPNDMAQLRRELEKRLRVDSDKACVIWVRVALMRIDEKLINDQNLTIIAKLLKDPDDDIAMQACRALFFIGRESKLKIDNLLAVLKHKNPRMRQQVVETLERIGPAAERTLPQIESLFNDSDEEVKKAAKKAYTTIKGKPPETKPGSPADPPQPPSSPTMRSASEAEVIAGKSLDEWIALINHSDPSIRAKAISSVVLFGQAARTAIPALTKEINRFNDYSPLSSAIIVVGQLVPLEKDADIVKRVVDSLIQSLNHHQAIIRYQSAVALGGCGTRAKPAIPILSRMIDERASWETRQAACIALGRAGRDEQGAPDILALQALIRAIDDPSKIVRSTALQSLIALGKPKADSERDQVKTLLERRLRTDTDKSCVIWVRVALIRLDEKTATSENLDVIAKLLKDSDDDIALQACRALYMLGKNSKLKMEELIEALRHANPRMRQLAAETLGIIGADASSAVAALETLRSDADEDVKKSAKQAVMNIKGVPRVVTPKP
jgi:HEAT repeat protein